MKTYLEECFLFWRAESVALFHADVPLEEGSGGDAARHPLNGDHVALTGNKRGLCVLAYEVGLQTCKTQEMISNIIRT